MHTFIHDRYVDVCMHTHACMCIEYINMHIYMCAYRKYLQGCMYLCASPLIRTKTQTDRQTDRHVYLRINMHSSTFCMALPTYAHLYASIAHIHTHINIHAYIIRRYIHRLPKKKENIHKCMHTHIYIDSLKRRNNLRQ